MKEKLLSNLAIVFVSHNANTVENPCYRVVWIADGVSQMEGDSADVVFAYEHYLTDRPNLAY